MMAGRRHSSSLVKMKPNPLGVAYPMSLRLLARYLAESLVTMSRSPAGTRPLRRSNNEKPITSPLHVTGQRRGLPTPYKLSSAYLLFSSVGADKPGGKFSCARRRRLLRGEPRHAHVLGATRHPHRA